MARKRNIEVTSEQAAAAVSKVLRDRRYSKSAMVAAGLSLTQSPDRKRRRLP